MPDFSFFVYEKFRERQKEVIEFIQKNIKNKMCIHAPSGFGKTPTILSALLPLAIKNDMKVLWAVKTGNETDRPIEELKQINKRTKTKIFGLSYRGKRDMCLLLNNFKMKDEFDYNDVSFLCSREHKNCRYFRNFQVIDKTNLADFLSSPLLFSEILKFCEEREICPYMLQKEMLKYARVVSMSYNYILDDNMRLKTDFGKAILVVDEAHNIREAVSSINSSKIYFSALDRVLKEAENFGEKEIEALVRNIKNFLISKKMRMRSGEEVVEISEFLDNVNSGIEDIENLLTLMKDVGDAVKEQQIKEGKAPRSSISHLAEFIDSVLKNAYEEGIALIIIKEGERLALEKVDMRCAELLHDKWDMFNSCIFCSGTLTPVEWFCETTGIKNYTMKVLPSIYGRENAKVFITRGLTTNWNKFNHEMATKYISAIKSFLLAYKRNTAIFSASYRIQDELIRHGLEEAIKSCNREIFLETQECEGKKIRNMLDKFSNSAGRGVLVATARGRFAEGTDFPGKSLEGIFLVGIPFDRVSVRTKIYIDYYQRLYGKEKGKYYAYIAPAFVRVAQALGRALRSRKDRAVFILGDERYSYSRFFRLLPDYIREDANLIDFEDSQIFEKINNF